MVRNIYLAGEGWGNECAMLGLKKHFGNVICIAGGGGGYLLNLRGEKIVFAGYKPIVPHCVLEHNECINIHYSLLPKYRGLHATVWSILNDEDYIGLTIHLMSDYIDDGPIIHQYKVANDRIRTSTDYMKMLNAYIADNLGQILLDFFDGKTALLENDKSKASWVGKRNREDCKIDFNRDINYQRCFFRALVSPYPLPYVVYKGEELTVTKVDFHPINIETHIGRILNVDDDGLWVKAKDGYLIIKELRDRNNCEVPFEKFKIGQYFNK